MAISNKLLDELLKDYKNSEDLLGENGIMRELKKNAYLNAFLMPNYPIIWDMKSIKKVALTTTAMATVKKLSLLKKTSLKLKCHATVKVIFNLKSSRKISVVSMALMKKLSQCMPSE